MKAEIVNTADIFIEIVLTPETVEEATLLLKYSSNSSAEKPYVRLSFREKLYCYICLRMVKPTATGARFSLTPKHQKY